MKIINLSEGNSLLNQYVAELRDVHIQNDRMRFRRNIERIGEIMAYEMSKALTYSVKQVQTPLGTATASTHDDKIVIATVFRAGLPLHTGFLNMFDHADNAQTPVGITLFEEERIGSKIAVQFDFTRVRGMPLPLPELFKTLLKRLVADAFGILHHHIVVLLTHDFHGC